MSQNYYLPRADKDRAVWLKNFSTKFTGIATSYGFVAADATAVAADSAAFSYIIDLLEIFKTEAKERTAYKDKLSDGPLGSPLGATPTLPVLPAAPPAVPAGIFVRISSIVKRIKAHPSYNDSIGKDLGIVAVANVSTASLVEEKPTITIIKNGGILQLKYRKGDAQGLKIFSRRADETEFTFLDKIFKPTYNDTRANKVPNQPETQEYKAYFLQDDKETGQSSDIISVVI